MTGRGRSRDLAVLRGGDVLYRENAGGILRQSADGSLAFAASGTYSNGAGDANFPYGSAVDFTYLNSVGYGAIASGNQAIGQENLTDFSSGANTVVFTFPSIAGVRYQINVLWLEVFFGSSGQRVWSCEIDGSAAPAPPVGQIYPGLTNMDAYDVTGATGGLALFGTQYVAQGDTISVECVAVVDNPNISAIEVLRV